MTKKTEVVAHIKKILKGDFSKLKKGYAALVNSLNDPNLEILLGIKTPTKMIATINSWIAAKAKKDDAPAKTAETKKASAKKTAPKKPFMGKLKSSYALWGFVTIVILMFLGLFALQYLDTDLTIDFQKASGGQRISTEMLELIGEGDVQKWDWDVYKNLFAAVNLLLWFHVLAIAVWATSKINVILDAGDNQSGRNWAAIFGNLIFLLAPVAPPLIGGGIVLVALMVQWRDKDSYAPLWIAPVALLAMGLTINIVGDNYLSLSTENLIGFFRMLLHWSYSMPREITWIVTYPLIIGFTILSFITGQKNRDTSGQANTHIDIAIYTILTGRILFSSYQGVFGVPVSMAGITFAYLFAAANVAIAFGLESKELAITKKADKGAVIRNLIVYVIQVIALTALLVRATPLSVFVSVLIAAVFAPLLVGSILYGGDKTTREMIEKKISGFSLVGMLLFPSTYLNLILIGLLLLSMIFPGIPEFLMKPGG